MPTLAFSAASGSSSTGHFDAGLFMSTSLTMGMSVAMRGPGAYGDMDLMTPLALNPFGGVSVTSILIGTVETLLIPDPMGSQSATGPLTFAAPVIPDLTASSSSASILVTSRDLLTVSSASLASGSILVTALTFVSPDQSAGHTQMIYPLPFSAGPQLGLSPSASLSSMPTLGITAPTRILVDQAVSVSAGNLSSLLVPANVSGTVAALSTSDATISIFQPVALDPSASVSDTEYAIPFVVIELTSAGASFTDLFMLVPRRITSRKVRGAGARRIDLVGSVPLGG